MEFTKNPIFKYNHLFKIENKSWAPCCAGIYFLTTMVGELETAYYIGSSKWLKGRLASHPVWIKMRRMGIFHAAYIIPLSDDEYTEDEKFYIKNLRPIGNVCHNPSAIKITYNKLKNAKD